MLHQSDIEPQCHQLQQTVSRSQVRELKLSFGIFNILRWFALSSLLFGDLASARGEGFVVGMHNERAEMTFSAKIHAEEPHEVFAPYQARKNSCGTGKRSFQRAQRRAAKHGYTWWKGKLFTAQQLGTTLEPCENPQFHPPNSVPQRQQVRQRITCLSWNSGGLGADKWDMLQLWLARQQISILCLQETRWPFTSEWAQQQYHIVHSGGGKQTAGLMCMVSKQLCSSDELSWQEPVPGRILHVRVHGAHRSLDIINVYQHVHTPQRLDERSEVWQHLSSLLGGLPIRNTALLLGDMNTSLQRRTDAVGLDTYNMDMTRSRGPNHTDSNVLMNILTTYALTALSTWTHELGPTYQFSSQGHHSRIDYICCRQHMADSTSRQVAYLHDFPLICHENSFHVPMMTSILKVWHHCTATKPMGWTRSQRLELCHRWQHPDSDVQLLQETVQQKIADIPVNDHTLDTLHETLNTFRIPVHHHKDHLFDHLDVTPFRTFQVHSLHLRALRHADLQNVFQAWFHVQQRCKARKQMKHSSRLARKQRLQKVYDAARRAEQACDPFRMWQAIRSIAPKQTFRRIHLRSDTGALLDPTQAADLLHEWFAQLYHSDDPPEPAGTLDWPFTCDEFELGLSELPLSKALDPRFAPAPLWRYATAQTAALLDPFCRQRCMDDDLPGVWSQGYICFLPKAAGRNHHPRDLRPIALLEPTGKTVMGMISHHLHDQLWSTLQGLPQFAYLPGRGADEALSRIAHFCREVRNVVENHHYPVRQQAFGIPVDELGGGLLLSLDLSKAFDMVGRRRLFQGLQSLGVSESLLNLLKSIYQQTSFAFEHKGCTREFRTTRGIRQGCKAAPALWTAQVALLLLEISAATTTDWMLDNSTTYADDCNFHQVIRSERQFLTLLTYLGQILDILEDSGFTVNLAKTTVMLKLVGQKAKHLQRRFIQRRKTGGAWLMIPRRNGQCTYIKLVAQQQFLGATVSFSNFERQTMLARIKAGEKTVQQISRWIFTQKGFNVSRKQLLWRQCVFTSMRYSLIPIGFTPSTIALLDVACYKHLRRIFREPVHLFRTTHQDFLTAHQIPDALALLWAFCHKAAGRDALRLETLAPHDILHRMKPIDYTERCQVLARAWEHLRQRRISVTHLEPDAQHECPVCQQLYPNLKTLRRHLTLEHDERTGPLRQPLPTDFDNGVPTCSRCKQHFTTWHGLRNHVQFVCMTDFQDPADPDEEVEHRVRVHELLQYACCLNLEALSMDVEIAAYFHTRCGICKFFCSTTKGLLQHFKTVHADVFTRHEGLNEQLLYRWPISSPCALRGETFKQYHKCLIIRQMSMLMTSMGLDFGTEHTEPLTCPICRKGYSTAHGLQQHLRDYHATVEACENLDPEVIQIHCHIHQAVEQNSCPDLLQLDEVRRFLTTRCATCQKSFGRPQDLSRHFKLNHASEWHESERRAMDLDTIYKPLHGCVCQPPRFNKRICPLFLQFALLRLEYERQQMPQVMALPPDMLLGIAEQIEPLLWHGHQKLLYKKCDLRLQLTIQCQICGHRCDSGDKLNHHLHAVHPDDLQEVQTLKQLFQWSMFSDLGCFCNPGPGWGAMHHECVGLTQLALIVAGFNWQVVVPWPFSSTQLTDLLGVLLPDAAMQRTAMALVTRNFHKLWQDPALTQMLKANCLICQDAVELKMLKAHLFVCHRITADRVAYLAEQLSLVYAELQSTDWHCDWCGEVLPSYEQDDDIQTCPLEHMPHCPFITQMALLLMMPVWTKPTYTPFLWPTHEVIREAQRQEELKLWQYNVTSSDTFGLAVDLLAQCGLMQIQDPLLHQCLNHRCLCCHKSFFLASKFREHLHREHNYLQMQTLMCYHRLALRCQQPCQFCGCSQHSSQCVALLNLAVYLTNGLGVRGKRGDRLCSQNLGQLTDLSTTASSRHRQGAADEQQTVQADAVQKEGQKQLGLIIIDDDSPDRVPDQPHEASAAPRGQHQHFAPRDGVHGVYEPGPREHLASTDGGQQTMACSGENGAITAPVSQDHAPDLGDSVGQAAGGASHRGLVSGLCSLSFDMHGSGQDHAVPQVEPAATEASTNQCARTSGTTGETELVQSPAPDGRPSCDAALPRASPSTGGTTDHTADSVVVDCEPSTFHGALLRVGQIGTPLYLAAHPSEDPRTKSDSISFGQAITENPMMGVIRILLNPSGRACAANSVLQCLAWLMLLADGFHFDLWHGGFILMSSLVQNSAIPLDLLTFGPFEWLLTGDWSIERFRQRQQDACEFCSYFLNFTKPGFLDCSWDTKPSFTDGLHALQLAGEKGTVVTPIVLPFIDVTADTCELQHLVIHWRDAPGLCRAATQDGYQLVLELNRHNDDDHQKVTQLIHFSLSITFPFFCNSFGEISMETFVICGVVYHLGVTPSTGHWRAALKYQGHWLMYDDACVPERVVQLPEHVHRNCLLVWLVRDTPHNARTMNHGDLPFPKTGSAEASNRTE